MRLTSPQQSDGGRAERTREKVYRGIIGQQRSKPLLSLRHIVLVQQYMLTTRNSNEVRNFNTQFVVAEVMDIKSQGNGLPGEKKDHPVDGHLFVVITD